MGRGRGAWRNNWLSTTTKEEYVDVEDALTQSTAKEDVE